jgi:hypothetical protein
LLAKITNDIYLTEEKALFTTQFKGKFQNCGNMGHKATDCKSRREKYPRVEAQVICNYFQNPGHYKADFFKLLRKSQNLGNSI